MQLGIALVGTGAMALRHAKALSGEENARLVSVCSTERSQERGKEFQRRFGFQRSVTNLEEVLGDPSVQVVYICTPDHTHPELAARSLLGGKHVFCEKPLAREEPGFKRVREALSATEDRVLQVGMNCRFREQYSKPKSILDSGVLGGIRLIRGNYYLNKVGSAKGREKCWWREFPKNVQFFLHANGIHILDLVRWYGGPVDSVFARASGFELGRDFGNDTFSISLRFRSGALGETLITSAAFVPRDISLEVWCEKGSLVGTDMYRRRGESVAAEPESIPVVQKVLDLGLQFRALHHAVELSEQPINSFQQAYQNFLLIRAIERSLDSGEPVSLSSSTTGFRCSPS